MFDNSKSLVGTSLRAETAVEKQQVTRKRNMLVVFEKAVLWWFTNCEVSSSIIAEAKPCIAVNIGHCSCINLNHLNDKQTETQIL